MHFPEMHTFTIYKEVIHELELEVVLLMKVVADRTKNMAKNIKAKPKTKQNLGAKKKMVSKKYRPKPTNEGVFKKKKACYKKVRWISPRQHATNVVS